jgi:hypothetical protein
LNKKLIAFLSIFSLSLSFFLIPTNASELTEKDKEYIQVPFNAWKQFESYKNHSNYIVRIKMHASQNIDANTKKLFQKGVEDMLNNFSSLFSPEDTFHIIMATSYDDAESLIKEVNTEMPGYSEFNNTHLLAAKLSLIDGQQQWSGGTSTRNCYYKGGIYGDNGRSVTPCPELMGGVIYSFNPTPSQLPQLQRVGGHEAFHLIMSKMNRMSHYRVPNWIIEGSIEAMSLTQVTNANNYKQFGLFFDPTPTWQPDVQTENYDLDTIDFPKNQSSMENWPIGFLAMSLLVSEVGVNKLFEFISIMGYPRDWKSDFASIFGFTASDFYKKFSEYHHWYFYEGGHKLIQNSEYFPKSVSKSKSVLITCIKGKTTKQVTGLNPKCPAGYKKK